MIDNGRGFDPAILNGASPGIGMTSMRTRAGSIGGSFHVARRRGGGMRIRVSWTAPESGT